MVYNHMMARSRGTGADPEGFYPTPEIGIMALIEAETPAKPNHHPLDLERESPCHSTTR